MSHDELRALKDAIRRRHGCEAMHLATLAVREASHGAPSWEGDVQVFALIDHSEATRCYAWSYADPSDAEWFPVVILHLPPIDSPEAAVRSMLRGDPEPWRKTV